MATFVEFDMDQGTTFIANVSLTEDTTNSSINLVNYTAFAQMRRSYYSANASGNLTVAFADAANGHIRMSMTSANTANMRIGRHLYDLKITDQNGVATRPIEGVITVYPQVSRS